MVGLCGRGHLAHKCPQHERKERVKLLPVHIFGAGGDVGRWQHPKCDTLAPKALQQLDDLPVVVQREVLTTGVE